MTERKLARELLVCACLVGACSADRPLSAAESFSTQPRRTWQRAALMPAFATPVMAALHDKVTLVGNGNEGTLTGTLETWEWDGSRWQPRTPAQRPSDRLLPGLARHGDSLIMFGGLTAWGLPPNSGPGETWRWDGSSWELQTPRRAPLARYQPSVATWRDKVLMFGGQQDNWGDLVDTWTWDDNWTVWPESGGPAGCVSPIATLGRTALMFCDASTWEWDGAYWTELQPQTRPSSRHGHVLAGFGDRVVMYGGYAESGNWQETWEWDGTDWRERTVTPSPPARDGYQLTQQADKLVLYGGGDGDTWTWDGQSWTLAARSAQPTPRRDYAIGTLGEQTILFGGCCKNAGIGPAQYWDDTWAWDGERWTELQPAHRPLPRAASKLAALSGKLVLFGGLRGDAVLSDTWEYDGSDWQERTPTASPPARQRAAMTAFGGSVYLFGGAATASAQDGSALADMWAWDGSQWRQVPLSTQPEPSAHAALSSFGGELVLLASSLSRLHVWDGERWSLRELDPALVPFIEPDAAVELIDAAGRSRLLVTGAGYGRYASSEWDGEGWSASIGLSVVMGPLAARGDAALSLGGWPLRTWLYSGAR